MIRDTRVLIALAMALGILLVVGCGQAPVPSGGAPEPTATTRPAAPAQPSGPPAISAAHQPIDQRSDCLACHKQGGFMPAPASHAGRTNDTCRGCHQAAAAEKPPVVNLVAGKTDKAPTLDGTAEDVWNKAKAATIHVNGGINKGETDVVLKAVYTQDTVYFLAQYKDPTESAKRQPWQKQVDGAWKKLPANPNYEDKFAMIWNIGNSMKGFNEQGCAVTCHATTPGRDQPLKYSNADGELGDIWHVKTVRTLPVGQIDDQYLDNDTKSVEAGRKSDAKTSGGYSDNVKEGQNTPPFALPNNKPAPLYYIMDGEKVAFDDTKYKANDEVPGIIISPFVGDRGDLPAKGVWKDGNWTFEWSRKLTTGSKTDVQFDNLKGEYFFGVAVFDNAQIGHAVQYGVTKLTFE